MNIVFIDITSEYTRLATLKCLYLRVYPDYKCQGHGRSSDAAYVHAWMPAYQTTRRQMPEDRHISTHSHRNRKYHGGRQRPLLLSTSTAVEPTQVEMRHDANQSMQNAWRWGDEKSEMGATWETRVVVGII